MVATEDASGAWLVVGLGNPGPDYTSTRHNVGAMVVDVLADRTGGTWRAHRSRQADVVEGRLGPMPGPRVVLARSRGFMNNIGGPLAGLAAFYKVDPPHIVAVHDELDIAYEAVRVKLGGGDGGHNGLRSMRRSLGTGEFYRVRVGIGRPPGRQDPADFVLKPFGPTERRHLGPHLERAADAVESLLTRGLEPTQNTYHS